MPRNKSKCEFWKLQNRKILNASFVFMASLILSACVSTTTEAISFRYGSLSCSESVRNFGNAEANVSLNRYGENSNSSFNLQAPVIANNSDGKRQRCEDVKKLVLQWEEKERLEKLKKLQLENERLRINNELSIIRAEHEQMMLMGKKIDPGNEF